MLSKHFLYVPWNFPCPNFLSLSLTIFLLLPSSLSLSQLSSLRSIVVLFHQLMLCFLSLTRIIKSSRHVSKGGGEGDKCKNDVVLWKTRLDIFICGFIITKFFLSEKTYDFEVLLGFRTKIIQTTTLQVIAMKVNFR